MKNIPLFTLALFFMVQLNAQEEMSDHSWVLGGSFNYFMQNNTYPLSTNISGLGGIGSIYSNNTGDTKNSNFSISPYVGGTLNEHWLLGLQLDFQKWRYQAPEAWVFTPPLGVLDTVDFERNSQQLGIGLFSRYTFNPDNSFQVFLQPYVKYNLFQEKEFQDTALTQEEKVNYIETGINGGMLYEINHRFRAILRFGGIRYINGNWKLENSTQEKNFSSFNINLSLASIYLGFEVKL